MAAMAARIGAVLRPAVALSRPALPYVLVGATAVPTALYRLQQLPRLRLHCEAAASHKAATLQAQLAAAKAPQRHAQQPQQQHVATVSEWDLLVALLRELQPDALLLVLAAATAVASALVMLSTPKVTGELANLLAQLAQTPAEKGSSTGQTSIWDTLSRILGNPQINRTAQKLAGLQLLNSALMSTYIILLSHVGENLAHRLRSKLFASLIRQDVPFFDERMSGDLVNRLTADVQTFKSNVKSSISQGLNAFTQTVGGFISLYSLSPMLTRFMIAALPLMYGFGHVYGAYVRYLNEQARRFDAISAAIANECLTNVRTVRAFAMEDVEDRRFANAVREAASMHKKYQFHIAFFKGLTFLATSGVAVAVMYFGGYLVSRGDLTAGQLMAYMLSTQTTQRALSILTSLQGDFSKALGAGARVFEFMELVPRVSVNGGLKLNAIEGDIRFHDVSFAYPTRADRTILDGFNLDVHKGQIVALCGPSGGGKSTVAALLERFYEPSNGEILLDGHPLSSLDPSWLRTQIGYINQEPTLFSTTIMENIRYGRPNATEEEVFEAARLANAHGFIATFPKGYKTNVGERGVALSGGQRQRIAIARAIVKNPKILLLDEATSALDAESEGLVQEALDRLMKGRTVLVIAHRLSTIKNANVICVMGRKGGEIVERGTHTELLAKQGVYAQLYNQIHSKPAV